METLNNVGSFKSIVFEYYKKLVSEITGFTVETITEFDGIKGDERLVQISLKEFPGLTIIFENDHKSQEAINPILRKFLVGVQESHPGLGVALRFKEVVKELLKDFHA